jgi:hypothetical protein
MRFTASALQHRDVAFFFPAYAVFPRQVFRFRATVKNEQIRGYRGCFGIPWRFGIAVTGYLLITDIATQIQ